MTIIKLGLDQLNQLDVNRFVEINNWLYEHTGSGYRWIRNDLQIDDDAVAILFRLTFGL